MADTRPTIDRIERLTQERFIQDFVSRGRPVVVTDVMTDWPALSGWTPERLRERIGDKAVTVTRRQGGVYRTADHLEMTISEYVDILQDPEKREDYYLTGLTTGQQLQELADDFSSPPFLGPEWGDQLHVWIGYNSRTINHYHSHHEALLCQVVGQKKVLLYPPGDTSALYPKGFFASDHNCSRVDAHDADLEKYPKFGSLTAIECTLDAGEALFIPVHWWHAVYGLNLSVSGTFFWDARIRDWRFPVPGIRCGTHMVLNRFPAFRRLIPSAWQKGGQ